MKHILSTIFFLLAALSTYAQEKFMDHITENNDKATVTVNQDHRLTDFVNGDYYEPEGKAVVSVRKVVQKQKMRGFRIQVYWGGNQNSEKGKAQKAGARVKAAFPELPVYTSFESPHWRCRVGNFADQDEAGEYLARIKRAKVAVDPIIVKSEVYLFK